MSHGQTSASSSDVLHQPSEWITPSQPHLPTNGLGTNTAILPMYWVSGQWMVPSSPSLQSQSQSQSASDPSLVSLVPHNARATLSSAPENINGFPRNNQRLDLPPLGIPSTSAANPQHLYRHFSDSIVPNAIDRGTEHYSQTSLPSLQFAIPKPGPVTSVPQQPMYHPVLPTRNSLWGHESRQRPQLNETRSDSRITSTYGERRHKAHLDSEKRRRESINHGLEALRQVLPATSDADSKAITLRKAVQYINHLEARLQELRRDQVDDSDPGLTIDFTTVKGETD